MKVTGRSCETADPQAGRAIRGARLGINAVISGRAKHFYSIYSKMTKKGCSTRSTTLTAMRVIVDSVKDCYGAVGATHSLWNPLPGRFKDFIAMPKSNMYQSLHPTVIAPEGRLVESQIRTRARHVMADSGSLPTGSTRRIIRQGFGGRWRP